MWLFRVFVSLLALTSLTVIPVLGQSNDGRIELNLGYLTSKSGRFASYGTFPAAKLAVDCINNRSDILPKYYLNLLTYDTKCDEAASVDMYFNHWTSATQPGPLFFGGGCSLDTGLPGDMSRAYHTVQITPTAGSPMFSNKIRYPYLFRAVPPETEIHRAQGVFVKHFGWDRVAMVVQNEHIFSDNITDIERYIKQELNISSVTTHIFPTRLPLEGLEALWSNTPRVIIINAYAAYTREILCQAIRRNIFYPNYQFIIVGWYPDNFWFNHTDGPEVDFTPSCTIEEFERHALYNLLTVNFVYLARNVNEETICGLSAKSFEAKYKQELNSMGIERSDFAAPTFDTVYAAALALNKSIPILESDLKLENFTFGTLNESERFASVVRDILAETNFSGVSGRFQFNEQFDRPQLQISVGRYQYMADSRMWSQEMVGEVTLQNMSFQGRSMEYIFPEGIPMVSPSTVHVALYSVMTVLAVVGIAFAVACLLFKVIFRKTGYIKMTSPNISYFIPVGAILLYCIIIISGMPITGLENRTVICNFDLWLGSLGFTLIFGGILVRTWRIHYIFNRIVVSKVKAKPPKDWMLIAAIGVFLAIDMVYLVIITGVPQTRIVAYEIQLVLSTIQVESCSAELYIVTILILAAYKSVYLWVGLYLAFETRKVKLKALHDSQYIAASVYISIMTCIACVPVAVWLRELVDVYYGVLSGILWLGLTTVLALTFLPKMVGLYRYRNTDMVEFELRSKNATASLGDMNSSREVASLQAKVRHLSSKLAEFDRSVGDVNDTAAPSEPTVKIQSQAQQVDYTVNRSSENGDSTIGSARAPSV